MAFKGAINGGFLFPEPLGYTKNVASGGFSTSSFTLDANTKKVGFIFLAPDTKTIDTAMAWVNGFTTSGNCVVSIQTITTADGKPTGTVVGSSQTIAISATGLLKATGLNASVTAGTYYALVIENSTGSYTIGAPSVSISFVNNVYCRYYSAGWEAANGTIGRSAFPNFGLKYNDGTYPWIAGTTACGAAMSKVQFNNTSAIREKGNQFVLPFPVRVIGWWGMIYQGQADFNVVLATTGGVALATFNGFANTDSYNYNFYGSTTAGIFTSPVDIAANTIFNLTLKPTTASNTAVVDRVLLDPATPGSIDTWNSGAACINVTRDGAGVYTTDNTKRCEMGLIIRGFDDGANLVIPSVTRIVNRQIGA